MRIAVLCPLWEQVPPPAYGGIEAVVSLLADELVHRGHEVTLFASGDSVTRATLCAVVDRSLRTSTGLANPQFYEWASIASAFVRASDFDVIHNHCGEPAMLFAAFSPRPVLTTCHGPLIVDSQVIWERYTGYYNTISRAAKEGLPDRNYLGVVYNGIDVESFPFCGEKEDFLLFLSRISPEKGTHIAIDVARVLGQRLVLAGKVDRVDQEYYEREIEPRIDGDLVRYVGEADASQKRSLFSRARCLVHPITWPEPFGLVMAEAMACGTPVVAFRRGAAPELIHHGETGFVVDDFDACCEAIRQVHHISPHRCREHVATRFGVSQMVDGYEALYQRLADGAHHDDTRG
ncbi:MAG: glycosyltransferase family 4 protein [Chloroflexi bacterium]|nr:glycosyltransferase family 4 protein [Chloroflexota bacterium]